MHLCESFLPSPSAKSMAIEVGLLSEQTDMPDLEYFDERDRLIRFQQMSLVADFESCLVVYYGVDLSQGQLCSLLGIYSTSKRLVTGHMLTVCLNNITSEHEQVVPNQQRIMEMSIAAAGILKGGQQ